MDDVTLERTLRELWGRADPPPAELTARMIAAVAAADLSEEYALLTLVVGAADTAVRGDDESMTLQFSDGRTSVLLHVTPMGDGRRRIDGWVDGPALRVELERDAETLTAPLDGGRFAFEGVAGGLCRLRVELAGVTDDGAPAQLRTTRFEV